MQQAINGSELGPWSTITGGARGPRRGLASLADMLCLALRHCAIRHMEVLRPEDHAAHAKVLLLQLPKVGPLEPWLILHI